jgi:hypothetical protein
MKTPGYYVFAFGASPLGGVAAVVCLSFAAASLVGNWIVLWDLAALFGVPIALVVFVGRHTGMPRQRIVTASIGAAMVTFALAFAILLIALSHANFTNPAL